MSRTYARIGGTVLFAPACFPDDASPLRLALPPARIGSGGAGEDTILVAAPPIAATAPPRLPRLRVRRAEVVGRR